jgi:hypothetical protein
MENNILNFLNSKNKYAYDIFQTSVILVVLPITFVIFHFLLGSEFYLGIFLVSIGYGRLISVFLLEKFVTTFPRDHRFTPFLRYISYTAEMLITFAITIALLKDAQENQSVLDKFNDEKTNTTISKPIDEGPFSSNV